MELNLSKSAILLINVIYSQTLQSTVVRFCVTTIAFNLFLGVFHGGLEPVEFRYVVIFDPAIMPLPPSRTSDSEKLGLTIYFSL